CARGVVYQDNYGSFSHEAFDFW
nr:immunoglobulin heavy chain junction region [Macaca mulatta]